MNDITMRRKIAVIVLAGVAYAIVGLALAEFAGAAATIPARNAWRLGAWGASAIIFAAQIWYELYRLHHSPRAAARYTSNSVEIGAFLLAVAAVMHSLSLPPAARPSNVGWALIAWPLMLGMVSFFVAFVVCSLLARAKKQ